MKSRLLFEKGHNLNTGLIQTELLEVKKQADVWASNKTGRIFRGRYIRA